MKTLIIIFITLLLLSCAKIEEPTAVDDIEKTSSEVLVWTNSPDPFTDSTKIKFYVPVYQSVLVIITDEDDSFVEVVHSGYTDTGLYEYYVGSDYQSGVYYFRVLSTTIKKLSMMKL